MGITPTTKAQISGHKFLTRRLEHGLVLGDIRMIHDPLATRNRAHVFSLAATVLICLGALAMAVFKPAIDPGDAAIIQAESGQLYVRIDNKLHPVANLASARLIVGEAADIHTGSDTVLKNLPKAIPIGIVDAPGLIAPPDTATQKLLSHACHTTTKPVNRLDTAPSQITVIMQETGANPTDTNQTTLTFQRLAVDHAIVGLVDQAEWLVTADGRRLLPPADTPDGRNIRHRLGIAPTTPRWSPPPQVFSAIAEKPPAAIPTGILEILRIPGANNPQLWARTADGVVHLTPIQADILLDAGIHMRDGTAMELGANPDSKTLTDLPLPDRVLTWVDPTAQPLCVAEHGEVETAPLIEGKPAWGEAVALAGKAVATHFVGPGWAVGVDTGSGIHVVSAHGLRHQVESQETAAALGISHFYSIRWDVLRLLPSGTTLSKQQALQPLY